MTAAPFQVIDFQQAEVGLPAKRLDQLHVDVSATMQATDRKLYALGVTDAPDVAYGFDWPSGSIQAFRVAEWEAGFRLSAFLERQVKKYRAMLNRALASDALGEEQRLEILQGMHGQRARSIETKPLSNDEREFIVQFRTMGTDDRQMFRTLLKRFAGAAEAVTGDAR